MAKARMTEVSPTPMVIPVLPAMYRAVADRTPPRRKPVIAARTVSCGMSPRYTFANHHVSFSSRVQVAICSSFSCLRAIRRARRRTDGLLAGVHRHDRCSAGRRLGGGASAGSPDVNPFGTVALGVLGCHRSDEREPAAGGPRRRLQIGRAHV